MACSKLIYPPEGAPTDACKQSYCRQISSKLFLQLVFIILSIKYLSKYWLILFVIHTCTLLLPMFVLSYYFTHLYVIFRTHKWHIMSYHIMLFHVKPCHHVISYIISCHIMPHHIMSCHLVSYHAFRFLYAWITVTNYNRIQVYIICFFTSEKIANPKPS